MADLPAHITKHWKHLIGKTLYVACSGGVDSIVLLHLLHQQNHSLSVIHVNYQLRGDDSDLDALCVQENCDLLGINCEIRKVDLASQLVEGGNLQAIARDVRYSWFQEILLANTDNCILLAHHADDQIETFFLNLARKSGVMGLSCMPAKRGRIYRPLLEFHKRDLRDFAVKSSITWREDLSNQSGKYRRNRLRNELIPAVQQEIPSIDKSVLTLIKHFQILQASLEVEVHPLLTSIKNEHVISIDDYRELDEFKRIELFRQLGISAKLVEQLDVLLTLDKGKKLTVEHPVYHSIVRDHKQLSFLKKKKSDYKLECNLVTALPIDFSKDELYLDASKLSGDLKIRRWELNDRIAPIGMKGTQLISDIIKDSKISAHEKQDVMVLHDDHAIHWCVGLKVGRTAIATPSSSEIIKCSISVQALQE